MAKNEIAVAENYIIISYFPSGEHRCDVKCLRFFQSSFLLADVIIISRVGSSHTHTHTHTASLSQWCIWCIINMLLLNKGDGRFRRIIGREHQMRYDIQRSFAWDVCVAWMKPSKKWLRERFFNFSIFQFDLTSILLNKPHGETNFPDGRGFVEETLIQTLSNIITTDWVVLIEHFPMNIPFQSLHHLHHN